MEKHKERELQEHRDNVDKLKQAAKHREKEDERAKRRLYKELPYKPKVVAGRKHCQVGNCQFILKYKRYKEGSRTCHVCKEDVDHACYSCLSENHEYDVCKECYKNVQCVM